MNDVPAGRRKVLVIDDSQMLLGFAREVLTGANYDVFTAASAREGLVVAAQNPPDLVLLDYVLPDMKGVDVTAQLRENGETSRVPIIFMTGFGHRVAPGEISGNVIASLNKPFTSDLLKRTIEQHMPERTVETTPPAAVETNASETREESFTPAEESSRATQESSFAPTEESSPPAGESFASATIDEPHPPDAAGSITESSEIAAAAGQASEPWWTTPAPAPAGEEQPAGEPSPMDQTSPASESFGGPATEITPPELMPSHSDFDAAPSPAFQPDAQPQFVAAPAEPIPVSDRTFFCGDSTFFSLHWALQSIGRQRLTGTLRCLWDNATVELLARNGEIVLVTTRDPDLYCAEAPITLVNVDAGQTSAARDQQRESGCPMFITLAQQNLVLQEPALQLVEHYGQKLFSQLWTAARVRFLFELSDLPAFAKDVPGEADVDQWALGTLRFIQYQELREVGTNDASCIPAYTRDGYDRVQTLRLTVAEAQFASQFNGVRSIAQIAKNLRLDIKFARLTLFRFLALEIVECWPPTAQVKQEKRGIFQRVGSLVGLGD
ncbi:MAG: response regulator [Chthoniobacterales bacterium]